MNNDTITATDIAEWIRTRDPGSPLADPNRYQIHNPNRVTLIPPPHPETYGLPAITVETFTREDGTRAYRWRTPHAERTGSFTGYGSAHAFATSIRDYLMGR